MTMLAGLFKMELPDRTVRLIDGGFTFWDGELYQSKDDVFGVIDSMQPIEDGEGDDAPDGSLTLIPASNAAASSLSRPEYQGSRLRFWVAEIHPMTGLVIGDPEQMADLMIDTVNYIVNRSGRRLVINFGSYAERFFLRNRGNTLSARFHSKHFPNERGFDNANGVGIGVAWGAEAPPRSSGAVGGGGGGFGGRIGIIAREVSLV